MIKLDLTKAYDHLEWGFIQDTLVGLGLLSHLIRVIMVCISTSSFMLIWNGETTEKFKPSRGL